MANTPGSSVHQEVSKFLPCYAKVSGGPQAHPIVMTDYLQTVRAVVNTSGTIRDRMLEYYPYGEPYAGTFGTLTESRRSFLSKENDLTGLLDFGPRYYSAPLGRFLSPDPILSSPSPYSYAEGNPVMRWDPSGLQGGPSFIPSTEFFEKIDAAARDAWAQQAMAEHRAEVLPSGQFPDSLITVLP